MAGLIVKSPYLKGGKASGYLKYIGTREGVELLPLEGYAKYIATRPRAQRLGSHGLFGDEDSVDLNAVMDELRSYTGNVWTHIISLKRGDAARLGYDNAESWRELLRAHRNDIAEAMKIPPRDFRWYAAFHNEGEHPHVHMLAWSRVPEQAYLSRDGIRQIRSVLTNHIFRQEMLQTYEKKTQSRDELVREARREMMRLIRRMERGIVSDPKLESLLSELAEQLPATGKMSYGYLPKRVKKLVDEVVDELEKLEVVGECYEKWSELQWQAESYYSDKPKKRRRLSEEKELRQIKNAVVQAADELRLGALTFEDEDLREYDEPDEFSSAGVYYYELERVVLDETLPIGPRDEAAEEMRSLAESGDIHAQYLLGKLCRNGGLLTPDVEMAAEYFRKAAIAGLPEAQYALGKLLLDDEALYDPETAFRWLAKAAEGGNDYAAYRLGKEYLKGKNIPKDAVKAEEYLARSAHVGNDYAQYLLGKLYLEGRELPRDEGLGWNYIYRAAGGGNNYAKYLSTRIGADCSPSVMLAATGLLHHMSRIFREHSMPKSSPHGIQIDRKRLRQLREKRLALGHKIDDHEEPERSGPTMSAP